MKDQVAITEMEHFMTTIAVAGPALRIPTIGHFNFWGLTFWRCCGGVYGALVAAAAVCVLVLDTLGLSDIPNIVWQLICLLYTSPSPRDS